MCTQPSGNAFISPPFSANRSLVPHRPSAPHLRFAGHVRVDQLRAIGLKGETPQVRRAFVREVILVCNFHPRARESYSSRRSEAGHIPARKALPNSIAKITPNKHSELRQKGKNIVSVNCIPHLDVSGFIYAAHFQP